MLGCFIWITWMILIKKWPISPVYGVARQFIDLSKLLQQH